MLTILSTYVRKHSTLFLSIVSFFLWVWILRNDNLGCHGPIQAFTKLESNTFFTHHGSGFIKLTTLHSILLIWSVYLFYIFPKNFIKRKKRAGNFRISVLIEREAKKQKFWLIVTAVFSVAFSLMTIITYSSYRLSANPYIQIVFGIESLARFFSVWIVYGYFRWVYQRSYDAKLY